MSDPYLYPDSIVLINLFGIRDQAQLNYVERELVVQRQSQGIPQGDFDLRHLCAIHFHLFQDLYGWAGKVRSVEIAMNGHQFQFCRFIETGMMDIHNRLLQSDYLSGLTPDDFANAAAAIMGDVNFVHPFREGNGRTQLLYFELLADRAGHPIRLSQFNPARWIEACRLAHDTDYSLMSEEIRRCLI